MIADTAGPPIEPNGDILDSIKSLTKHIMHL